jgi:hypothetical protein
MYKVKIVVLKRVYKKLGLKRVSSLKLIPVFMLEWQVFVILGNFDGKLNFVLSRETNLVFLKKKMSHLF